MWNHKIQKQLVPDRVIPRLGKYFAFLYSVQGVTNDIIDQCCEQGKLQISEGCGNFTFPIANISSQHQNVCIATMEVCCLAEKRSEACSRGKSAKCLQK